MGENKTQGRKGRLNLKKSSTVILKEDKVVEGFNYPEGTKLVRGVRCPNPDCDTFYPTASDVTNCNVCGYVAKRLKPWQLKRKEKKMKRGELSYGNK